VTKKNKRDDSDSDVSDPSDDDDSDSDDSDEKRKSSRKKNASSSSTKQRQIQLPTHVAGGKTDNHHTHQQQGRKFPPQAIAQIFPQNNPYTYAPSTPAPAATPFSAGPPMEQYFHQPRSRARSRSRRRTKNRSRSRSQSESSSSSSEESGPIFIKVHSCASTPNKKNILTNWKIPKKVQKQAAGIMDLNEENSGIQIEEPGLYLVGYDLAFLGRNSSYGYLQLSSLKSKQQVPAVPLKAFTTSRDQNQDVFCVSGSIPVKIDEDDKKGPWLLQIYLGKGKLVEVSSTKPFPINFWVLKLD